MNNTVYRHQQLLSIIELKGMLPVKTLSQMLGVSEMTIRRDLKALREWKLSSVADSDSRTSSSGYDLLKELGKRNDQKNKIGQLAASMLEPNDVFVIDTGSTTACILPHISYEEPLTSLSFNSNVLDELRKHKNIDILFCGGYYHRQTEMFECSESLAFIEKTRFNKVFLSAAGIHKNLGVTCMNGYEVATKQAIIRASQERILLVDSSKFDKVCSSFFCNLSDITTIITDNDCPQKWQKQIRAQGINLHVV